MSVEYRANDLAIETKRARLGLSQLRPIDAAERILSQFEDRAIGAMCAGSGHTSYKQEFYVSVAVAGEVKVHLMRRMMEQGYSGVEVGTKPTPGNSDKNFVVLQVSASWPSEPVERRDEETEEGPE